MAANLCLLGREAVVIGGKSSTSDADVFFGTFTDSI